MLSVNSRRTSTIYVFTCLLINVLMLFIIIDPTYFRVSKLEALKNVAKGFGTAEDVTEVCSLSYLLDG